MSEREKVRILLLLFMVLLVSAMALHVLGRDPAEAGRSSMREFGGTIFGLLVGYLSPKK